MPSFRFVIRPAWLQAERARSRRLVRTNTWRSATAWSAPHPRSAEEVRTGCSPPWWVGRGPTEAPDHARPNDWTSTVSCR